MTLLINPELASRSKLCLVSVFPDIVHDCRKMRNLPKIFLRSFENVAPGSVPGLDLESSRQSPISLRIITVSQRRKAVRCGVSSDPSVKPETAEKHGGELVLLLE